jgi:manganese/zinc/iron transport system permease protein
MLVLAVVLGALASFGGYYLAVALNGSIAGGMVSLAGAFMLITVLVLRFQKTKANSKALK